MFRLVLANNKNIVFPEGKSLFWHQEPDGSWYSPRFGHVYHVAIVDPQEGGNLLWKGDCMLHEDGPVARPYEHAKGGSVVVPYRVNDSGTYHFRGFMQERPVIFNPETDETGTREFSFPGGFALPGELDALDVKRHALEEAGIELLAPRLVAIATSNRMFIPTPISYFVAEYRPIGRRIEEAQGFEQILGNVEILASQMPLECMDGITWTAWAMAVRILGLVRNK